MKLYIYFFSVLIITGLFSVTLTAQNQQQETQAEATSQGIQPQDQAKTQTQSPAAPKPKTFPDDLNITDQFGYAIDKSSNFQDYKVIKQTWMSKLKSNTLDTLLTLKSNLKSSKDMIEEKTRIIESLRSELNSTKSELKEKNSFNFFGIMVSKAGYDSIMWAIIIGLLVGLGFIIAAFRRSFAVTSQTKKDLNEVKEEFESFRKKALKSKEEAVRQLYNEINKFKNNK